MTLALGMALDAALGEPRWLWSRVPHPAVLMGRLIALADARLNRGAGRRAKGAAVIAAMVAGAIALGLGLQALPGALAEVLCLGVLLAQRSLAEHVRAVAVALNQSLPQGRAAVAMIVGRETAQMDAAAVARAAIESAAENLSDGVIAPLFWYCLAGLPGLLAYKIVNTADSMIGYRTPRHANFGWGAARLDDALNWIPARLTAVLIWAVRRKGHWREIAADARRHRSPNAGWPEAALARHLDVALAGPRRYDGALVDLAWVHAAGHPARTRDIEEAVRALWWVWGLVFVCALGGAAVMAA